MVPQILVDSNPYLKYPTIGKAPYVCRTFLGLSFGVSKQGGPRLVTHDYHVIKQSIDLCMGVVLILARLGLRVWGLGRRV